MNESTMYILEDDPIMGDKLFLRLHVCVKKDKVLVKKIINIDGVENIYSGDAYKIKFQVAKCFDLEMVKRQVEMIVKEHIKSVMTADELTNGSNEAPNRIKKLLSIEKI